MGLSKSQVGFYTALLSETLFDDPLHLCSTRSIKRDIETITSRVAYEGLGFLTKTLPRLGRALDRGLTEMRFTIPSEFKPAKDMSTPAFMQVYFKRIFDCDGGLLDDADPAAISHVRQVCFLLYKLEVPYKAADERRVIDRFEAVECELKLSDDAEPSDEIIGASYIVRGALNGFDHKDILPKHGPGAVATGERLDKKWAFARLYDSIHQVYPYYDYFIVGGGRELKDRLDWYMSMARLKTGCAKVVLVPKDSRGPRLISAEPLEFQYIQQGLGRKLVAHLESSRMTGGRLNFGNQEINRELALTASLVGDFATLDLKDASDRVSLRLVRQLFQHNPELLRALEGTRTTETLLPDGRRIPLAKFAPMGSALCFPVEALCFWAICVSAISRWARLPEAEVGNDVYVFGDDIIVRTEYAGVCMDALERVGLKVNRDKSCISGGFRESCGMDAFRGVCVTPTRLKTLWSGRDTDGAAYVSYIAFANQMAEKGYLNAADFVWKALSKVYGRVPFGISTTSYPCRIVSDFETALRLNVASYRSRWNSALCRLEFWVLRTKSRRVTSKLKGWCRLLRDLLDPAVDRDPSDIVVPRSMRIKRGWAAIGS
jgi:hypothetical protein